MISVIIHWLISFSDIDGNTIYLDLWCVSTTWNCWWGQSKLWIGVGAIKSEFSIINLIKIAVWPWLHFMFIWSIFITWLVILPFRNISEASEWMIMISWPQLIAYSGVMWKLVQWNVIRQLSNPWNSSRVLFKLRVVIHTPVGTETQEFVSTRSLLGWVIYLQLPTSCQKVSCLRPMEDSIWGNFSSTFVHWMSNPFPTMG